MLAALGWNVSGLERGLKTPWLCSGKQGPHALELALGALHTRRLCGPTKTQLSEHCAVLAGVAFGVGLGLALLLVCMTLGQRACCPRPRRFQSVPPGGKAASDVELGAKDLGVGPSPGPELGGIGDTPAPTPAPWLGSDPAKGSVQGSRALSRAGSLQASRAASRQGSFTGRAWRSWRRMEEIGPAGGLEVTGLREGRPVVLYDGPLGKVPHDLMFHVL